MADRWEDLDRYMTEWTENERRRIEREREGRLAAYEEMKALIEASSFGTPGAKALRSRTPPEVVAEITRRIQRG